MKTTHAQTITFTKPEIEYLRAEAKRLGISVADVVRRIIDQHQEQKGNSDVARLRTDPAPQGRNVRPT